MRRFTILLAAFLAVPAGAAHAQSRWALAGRIGLSKEFGQLDGPPLGSVGGEVAVLHYVGRKTALGIELGWYDFGTSAGAQYYTDPPTYDNYYSGSTALVALTLRVQDPSKAHAGFFVTSLGISRYTSSGAFYSGSSAAASALALGVGGGVGLVRLTSHLQLGVEGRLHGAIGGTEGGLAAWSWATLGASILIH